MDINKIYNENCLDTMAKMPDNFVDLTVTSPPYDSLRDYKGFKFPFKHIARHLERVTKWGGVVVWIVGDQTIDGSETGTGFRQALFFKELGMPCPALSIQNEDACCGLVMIEEIAGLDPVVRKILGIGCGCSCPDENTTEAEIEAFDEYSEKLVYG